MPNYNDYISNFIPLAEGLQYRAIGLLKGTWLPSLDEPQKGTFLTSEGIILDAVMLGKCLKICKHHDLTQEQLFVFYPRKTSEKCQIQIMGIWDKQVSVNPTDANGYISVRGEIAYQSKPTDEDQKVVVMIRRSPKKEGDKPSVFKLTLKGKLSHFSLGGFWDITCKMIGDKIVIQWGAEIRKPQRKTKSKEARVTFKSDSSKARVIKKKVVV